jgi:site-specific DNA recombinase
MASSTIKPLRCAIYTRKSTEHGLELEFNSLDAQRDACEAYIKARPHRGGKPCPSIMTTPPIPAATWIALPFSCS